VSGRKWWCRFWGKNGGTAGEKADWGGRSVFFSAEREKEVSTGWGAAVEMKKEGGNSREGELGRLSRREKTEREEEKWKPPGGGRRLLLEKKKNKFCRVRWVRFFRVCSSLFFLSKMPPLVWLKMKAIYRQSSFFGLQNWSLKFCVWPLISNNSFGKN
jgi:hypothetical protein